MIWHSRCVVALCLAACSSNSPVSVNGVIPDTASDAATPADMSQQGQCSGVACTTPPANYCVDQTTLRAYPESGTCSNGLCSYEHTDLTCGSGCQDGACVGNDPCNGLTCNSPPAASCTDSHTLKTYSSSGTCSSGTCSYTSITTTCANGCQAGACQGDPCAGVACDRPPSPYCLDEHTRRSFPASGTCGGGNCSYSPIDTSCANGCSGGSCNSDPCAGVTCNQPPAPSCLNSTTRRSYSSTGTCNSGSCSYVSTDTSCVHGCSGGTCSADPCAGVTCNQPPASYCPTATTLRMFSSAGTCSGGACAYGTTITTCTAAPANATPTCDGASCGFTCNDGYVKSGSECICVHGWCSVTALAGAPSTRAGHSAVWTGTEMIIWGGHTGNNDFQDGGRFNPSTNAWSSLSTSGAPAARRGHSAVWTGTEMIVWGGIEDVGNTFYQDGGRFNPSSNTWIPLTQNGTLPTARYEHSAVWTGTEMIVWGGGGSVLSHGSYTYQDGGRFNPSSNTWISLTENGTLPTARSNHSAVWIGSDMIVWGGEDGAVVLQDGGRFNPSTNSWNTLSTTGAPSARWDLSAVWTGSEMIIWGGANLTALQDGGRFNPSTNSWNTLSMIGAPSARYEHSAVWTGTRMIVWGGLGSSYLQDGGIWLP